MIADNTPVTAESITDEQIRVLYCRGRIAYNTAREAIWGRDDDARQRCANIHNATHTPGEIDLSVVVLEACS